MGARGAMNNIKNVRINLNMVADSEHQRTLHCNIFSEPPYKAMLLIGQQQANVI